MLYLISFSMSCTATQPGADSEVEITDPPTTELDFQVGSDVNWSDLALGDASSCGVRPNGRVECWGCNWDGEDTASWAVQDQCVPPAGVEFASLSAAVFPTCGLTSTKSAACFGDYSYVDTVPIEGPYDAVVAGPIFGCARSLGTNRIDCWELGYSAVDIGEVFGPGGLYFGVAGGCVLDEAGHITPFQPADAVPKYLDRYIPPNPDATFLDLSLGPYGACGRSRDDNTISCWTDSQTDKKHVDVGVHSPVLDYALNYWQGCAITDDKSLHCWGPFEADGTTTAMQTPPGDYDRVWVGTRHSCARRTDAAIVCWGDNQYGQATPK